MKTNWKILVGLLIALAVFGGLLWRNALTILNPSWAQPTMGTVAHITVSGSISKKELAALRDQIDAVLEEVNNTLSTWKDDSDISRFNRFQSLKKFQISPGLAGVAEAALEFSRATGGAFDPTVKPLIDYWGFGKSGISNSEQGLSTIDELLDSVGWKKVHLNGRHLRKENPALQLDFSAIAKGYGVDRVADVIAQSRTDFLVEIGGEIVTVGSNPQGHPWTVGIENPDPASAFGRKIFQTVALSGQAMATSGDYRNFQLRADGTRYSHIIDPRTGKPAESDIAAVSVLAARCMNADAAATALFVMGSEKGFHWLKTHSEFDAFFILHNPDKPGFTSKATPGFPSSNR